VSPDFERRLREARGTLPEPEPGATERARAGALRSLRRRRPRARLAALVGVAVGVALAVGAALGTLIAPDVTASRGPVGLGFVPQPGWYVLQTSARERLDDPVVTIAANVPFAREDDVGGLAEASGLPYETLLGLPPNGVVIVATFLPEGVLYSHLDPTDPQTTLPLQLSRAVPRVLYGTQVRPEAPLGQYQLRAAIEGYSVDVIVYFGRERPTTAQFLAAQRQLSSLVVRTAPAAQPARKAAPKRSEATVFDRTFSCATLLNGGIHEIEARGHAGIRELGSRWKSLPFAVVATGSATSVDTRLDTSLAWITAGAPSQTTLIEEGGYGPQTVLSQGTLAVNLRQCVSTRARVPLSPEGLRGGAAGQLGAIVDCETPHRVLVRVRARLSSGTLRRSRGFLRTQATAGEAALAARTANGRPLVYATVATSGSARLFTSAGCAPE
jgi:hypothetical protein